MIYDWLAFWDSRHFLYANARHKDAHYRLVAQAIAALVPSREARRLDRSEGAEAVEPARSPAASRRTPSLPAISRLNSARAGPSPGAG